MKICEKLLQGGRVGFFGFGRSSLGILDYLSAKIPIMEVTVRSDGKPDKPIPKDARILIGEDADKDIDEDVLFISPSVRRDRRAIADASRRGVLLSSDAELFFEQCADPVLAITGSDGKSSCTYLAAAMLREDGTNAVAAGNFGRSLCTTLDSSDTVVAELSSFQLNFFTPKVSRALITNLSPNHLNWHKDFDEYAEAKLALIRHSDAAVLDCDSPLLRERIKDYGPFFAVSSSLSYRELSSRVRAEGYMTLDSRFILLNGEKYINKPILSLQSEL